MIVIKHPASGCESQDAPVPPWAYQDPGQWSFPGGEGLALSVGPFPSEPRRLPASWAIGARWTPRADRWYCTAAGVQLGHCSLLRRLCGSFPVAPSRMLR